MPGAPAPPPDEVAIHPRLSVHATCAWSNDFTADLALWESLGIRRVGLSEHKLDAHGRDLAAGELLRRGIEVTSLVTGWFDLTDPQRWPAQREVIRSAIDTAAELGAGCVYLPPGASDGRSWEDLLAAFAAAIGPCVEYAAAGEVRLAFEPSARTQVSFVNTLRDSLTVIERVDVGVDVDFASCWMERDLEGAIADLAGSVALVQVADIGIGAIRRTQDVDVRVPAATGRLVPGDGDLELERLLRATLDAGYEGPFELELLGPAIEAEGYEPALRRALVATTDLLNRVGA